MPQVLVHQDGAGALVVLRQQLATKVATRIGVPQDGVLFVIDALGVAQRRHGKRHITARELCEGLREWSMTYFNDAAEAKDLLAEWGLCRSEDVGRIVCGLVSAGLAQAAEEDSQADFNGLFTLENLFASGGSDRR
jgi:uncharacterized repeat protein (TIGR04138 family)